MTKPKKYGSPHEKGCTFTALSEVAKTLRNNDVESEILWIGNRAVQGCVACWKCQEGNDSCVFKDKLYLEFVAKMKGSDGLVIGSPVCYAGPPGSLCAILDRVFFSASKWFEHKPAACVVNCRRGGASAAFDRLNKYFTILQMPVVSNQYWNSTHGFTPEELQWDLEGLQTMRTLGNNMAAYLLKTAKESNLPLPVPEPRIATKFISRT